MLKQWGGGGNIDLTAYTTHTLNAKAALLVRYWGYDAVNGTGSLTPNTITYNTEGTENVGHIAYLVTSEYGTSRLTLQGPSGIDLYLINLDTAKGCYKSFNLGSTIFDLKESLFENNATAHLYISQTPPLRMDGYFRLMPLMRPLTKRRPYAKQRFSLN